MIELHHENGLEPLRPYPSPSAKISYKRIGARDRAYGLKMGVSRRIVKSVGGADYLRTLPVHIQRLLLGTSR